MNKIGGWEMNRVTPQKNKDAFLRWERERIWLMRGFWTLVFLVFFIFAVYPLVYSLMYPLVYWLVHTFIPIAPAEEITAPGVEQPVWLPAIVVLGLFYIITLIVIRWRIKWRLGRLSKEACIYAAIVAAEDLERGNPVRASLSMDRLLSALSDFLGQKLVKLGVSSVTPQDFMHVTPETIPRRAVRRAIQANEDTKDFQERLRNLAIGFRGNVDEGYLAAHQFLVWLDQKTERYQPTSKTFLDKHPTLRTVLLKLAPVFLPPVSAIVVALL